MGVAEKIRALFHTFLLFTVLVAVALVSAITTIRIAIRGRQTTVPNLVGGALEASVRVARAQGLDVRVEDRLYSSLPAGSVVSQLPAAGTPIKLGQRIHVLVSLGPKHVQVPNAVGSSLRAAEIMAIQRGLTVVDVVEAHLPGGGANNIVAQDPPPAAAGVRGPTVNFLVSLGEPAPSYYCPDFVGQRLTEARPRIEKGGFKVGQILPVTGQTAGPGTILSQSPPPGSKIDPDTVFDFHVAQ